MMTASQEKLIAAVRDSKSTIERLDVNGQESRAVALAVACDLIISAAFLFSTTDQDCDRATDEIRHAIKYSLREEQ